MTEESNVQPLSTDDLRANASKWTLAGDVGLLAHLEEFSNKIFEKAETTENALNNLLDRVEEVSTNFSNVSNQFQSLHNSQFLENRVYDDETPTDDNVPVVKKLDETQQQVLTKYKDAVVNGLHLLDTHFEQVELPQSSDSEDEPSNGGSSLLLKPKIAYTKPLPLVIGSAEWWADDTVGLGEFLENDESEPELSNSESPPHAIEKRLRLSSSSASNSSEIVGVERKNSNLSVGFGSTIDEPDQLFAPVTMHQNKEERESGSLFGGNSNLFEDDDGLFDKPPPIKSSQSHQSSSNAVKSDVSASSKKPTEVLKDSVFWGEDEADDSMFNSQPILPSTGDSKVSSDFTKELFAKLGSVANNQNKSQNFKTLSSKEVNQQQSRLLPSETANESQSKLQSKEVTQTTQGLPIKKEDDVFGKGTDKKPMGTGLFDNDCNFDDGFLFGSNTAPVRTASSRPLAVPSKLFDDEEEDLTPTAAINSNKPAVNHPIENKNLKIQSGSSSKKAKSTNIFTDNLFSDDLEDDLFSAISPKPPVRAVFPRVTVTMNDTNSPVFVEQSGLKSSTPAVGISTPDDNLFGSISRLEKVDSSGESEVSNNSENLLEHPSNDDARIESVQYDSRDLGFIETSDISEISNSENRDSPANWFQPQFSSTRAAAVTNETSGYKTVTIGPSVDSAVTSSSTENSSANRINQKISSIAEESSSVSIQKNVRTDDGSINLRRAVDDLFVDEHKNRTSIPHQEEPDDLFKYAVSASKVGSHSKSNATIVVKEKSRQQTKPVKPLSLFDDEEDEDDNLFSSKLPANSKIILDKPLFNASQNQDHPKTIISKPSSLFSDDVEDNVLFGDGSNKPQDNVSISSGRSSVFDEPAVGKSTLPSIFGDKPSIMRTSLFEDVDDNIDLFSNKIPLEKPPKVDKVNVKDVDDSSDLFSDNKQLEVKDEHNLVKQLPSQNDLTYLLPTMKPSPPSSLNIHKQSNDLKSSHQVVVKDVNDDADLFSNQKPFVKPRKLGRDENNSTTISNDKLPSKNEEIHKNGSSNLLVNEKPTPPSSLPISKPTYDKKSGDQGGAEKATVAVTKKIGKLNIPSNLKINPAALLPGAKLAKPTENEANTIKVLVPFNVDSASDHAKIIETESNTNESPISVSEHILPTSLKDRVRISVKRRPQSRRARQDALRTSGIDFSPTEDTASISPSSASFSTPHNIISPSTDEEDFHVPDLDLANEKDDQNIFNDVLSKREEPHTIDESLLFNNAPVISPAKDKNEMKPKINTMSLFSGKSSLFEEKDDDNDLFSSVKPVTSMIPEKKPSLPTSQKVKGNSVLSEKKFKNSAAAIKTESLFSDADDDDDIFSGKSTTTQTANTSTVSTLPKPNLDNISQDFLDPLGLLMESKD